MDKIQIIGVPQSNYVWAVRMACEEKGVPYEIVPVRPHTPDIDALHPLGKIPGMRHGDVALCESKAIATYIDRTFPGPKLIPEDLRDAAQVEQWVSLVNTSIDPCLVRTYLLAYFFPKTVDGKPDRAAIDGVLPAMEKQIGLLDTAVAKTGYLAGARFTLADINLLPILYYVQRMPEGGEMIGAAQSLAGYFARHSERPRLQGQRTPAPARPPALIRLPCLPAAERTGGKSVTRRQSCKRLESRAIPGRWRRRPARNRPFRADAAGRIGNDLS